MGIGHVAVGLGLKRVDRATNAGWLIFAAFLPDLLLGLFALAGWEDYQVPPDYASKRYLLFTFPFSHGLLADLAWSSLAGLVTFVLTKRRAAALAVSAAVLSHFVLDGIVHVKGLPLAVGDSPVLGLGLWRYLPLALTLEVVMLAAGWWIYFQAIRADSRGRATSMAFYGLFLAAFLIVGQLNATSAPPRLGLIAGWLAFPPLVAAIALWLDRERRLV